MSKARLLRLIVLLTRVIAKMDKQGKHDRAALAGEMRRGLCELYRRKFGGGR